MPLGTAPGTGISGDVQSRKATSTGTQEVSALGESFDKTPLVVPVRGHLDSIKRLLKGDIYIGPRVQTTVTSQEPILQYVQGIASWEVCSDLEFSASVAR